MNNGRFTGDFTATERSGTGGITGTEIRNGAVQKTALRLYSGTITGRPEAKAEGIRILNRTVYVRSDYPGNPGTAGKRAMHVCGSLIIHFHVFSLWSFPPLLGVHLHPAVVPLYAPFIQFFHIQRHFRLHRLASFV